MKLIDLNFLILTQKLTEISRRTREGFYKGFFIKYEIIFISDHLSIVISIIENMDVPVT